MDTAYVIVPVADIYKDHIFSSEVVTQALIGEKVTILDTYDNWSRIKQWDRYEGWINNFYLRASDNFDYLTYLKPLEDQLNNIPICIDTQSPNHLFSNPSELKIRKEVILDCVKFLGVPYKWGGKSSFGFDCSGFVQTVFKISGVSMPRDSKNQYEVVKNNRIDLKNAKSGDLIFFQENEKICHVGIYNKGLKFTHSSGMVKENSLDKEDELFDKKLMDKFVGIFSMSEIIKEQLNE